MYCGKRCQSLFYALVLLLLMLALTACGGDDKDTNSDGDSTDQIAYLFRVRNMPPSLIIMDADGRHDDRLAEEVRVFAWSPDGSKIGYLTPSSLNIIDPNGRNRRTLVDDEEVLNFVWSPDGRKIVFLTRPSLDIIDADGRNRRTISEDHTIGRFVWSPDSRQIAFDQDSDIYVIDSDGQNERRLTDSGVDKSQLSWSPDGGKVAFVISDDNRSELIVMDVNGDNETHLMEISGTIRRYKWSPDGDQIAYFAGSDVNSLYVIDVDGTADPSELLPSNYSDSGDFAWLPGGNELIFVGGLSTASEERIWAIDRFNLETDEHTELDFDGNFRPFSEFSLSPDGHRMVMLGRQGDSAIQIYIVTVDGDIRRLTDDDALYRFPIWRPR